MTAWKDMDAHDKVVIWTAGVIGLFLILSLIGVFVLAITDRETGAVWDRVFELVGVLSGGLVGYIAGSSVARGRQESKRGKEDH